MNRTLSILTSVALLSLPVVAILAVFAWLYNGIVNKEERVYQAWSQVESNLQRRADLIPGLVETVSRYMRHERETLDDVTDQRAGALEPLDEAARRLMADQERVAGAGGATPEDERALAQLADTQRTLAGSIRRFMAVAESYPSLKAGDQFLSLQAQLEGTENRINVARMEFNRAVGSFNGAIRRLPGTLVASLGGFRRKGYFEAQGDAGEPAELEFAGN
ncbi:MAG: LemA family protein [Pseudomonadota bacterium]